MLVQDDQRLAYEVERVIGQMPGLNINEFRVTVDRGRARLVGVVEKESDKQRVIQAAQSVDGIVSVDEAIAVEIREGAAVS
jgi:osmotically-inducible protein OsmY